MSRITIRHVAAEAGVSVATVSRILRDVAAYSHDEQTQLRVREAAAKLNYRPNMAAQLLREQKKRLVGLVSELTVTPHANEVIVAVRNELRAHGLEPVMIEPDQLRPDYRQSGFPNLELLAGLICYFPTGYDLLDETVQDLGNQFPVVTLYPKSDPEAEWIYMDLAAGVQLAASHLVELGHKAIAFAGYDLFSTSPTLKALGWQSAVEEFNLLRSEELTYWLERGVSLEEAGIRVANWLNGLQEPPTALICTSDELALSVLGRLAGLGWQLPQRLSVVGMDGIRFGAYSHPPLTSVMKLSAELARLAVERLLYKLENPDAGALPRQMVQPQLLIRGSTAPPGEGQRDPASL